MKIKIKNKEEFKKLILKDVKEALDKKASEKIKKIESEMVKDQYDKYTPEVYRRRGDNGGLSDINNMKHTITDKNNKVLITVKNTTQVNPEFYYQYHPHLDQIVEDGTTYPLWFEDDPSKYSFLKPRPFLKETQKKIDNGEVNDIIIKELRNKGWKI